MGHAVNNRPIIAVTCLSFEAQVAAGPGIDVLCGTAQRYVDKLERRRRGRRQRHHQHRHCRRPGAGLAPGDWVVASGVVADGVRIPTDQSLVAAAARRRCRARSMPTFPGSMRRWWRRPTSARCTNPPAPSRSTWNPISPPGSPPGTACRSRPAASSSIRRSGRCRRRRWSACAPTAGPTCSP